MQRAPGRGRMISYRDGHGTAGGGQLKDCLILLRSIDEREGIGSIPFIRSNNYFANTFLSALREEMKSECGRFRFCHYAEGSDPLDVLRKADLSDCNGSPIAEMGHAAGQLYKLERAHPGSTFTRLINPKLVVCGSCGG